MSHAVYFRPEVSNYHFLLFQQRPHILVCDDPKGCAAFITMHGTQWESGIDRLNRFEPEGSGLAFCAFGSGAETKHENSAPSPDVAYDELISRNKNNCAADSQSNQGHYENRGEH